MLEIIEHHYLPQKNKLVGYVDKCLLESLGLFRTNSDPRLIILMRDSPLGRITQVYIYIYMCIYIYIYIYIYIGVRDCPYGICCPWVRGGWDLDALGQFVCRRRRRHPRLKNQFSKCAMLLHTLAHCSILRFCHKQGQNKRWGAVRHVKRSGISIRVYSVLKSIANISIYNPKCSQTYTYIGGGHARHS